MDKVSWIENAYELLDEPGEWYLDRNLGTVYYKPAAGEDMASAEVVLPVLEILAEARGTPDAPLRNVSFQRLTFAYATWLLPSTDEGYPDIQGTYTNGNSDLGEAFGQGAALFNVNLKAVLNLELERNRFLRMGGTALGLDAGSRDCRIIGNEFRDISGNGLHIGTIDANPSDTRRRVQRITVENNFIARVGQEYHGCAAIFAGYVEGVAIRHNEITDIPHMGISVGWGWGTVSYAGTNEIAYNLIHDIMKRMHDGGGVYTLSPQPGTVIHHNHIRHQRHELGSLYPDEGTKFTRWHHNVLESVVRWLHLWTPSITDNTIDSNYYDNPTLTNDGRNNTLKDNVHVTGGEWPPAVRAIMAGVGLQAEYRDVRDPVPLRPENDWDRSGSGAQFAVRPGKGGVMLERPGMRPVRVGVFDLRGSLRAGRSANGPFRQWLSLDPGMYLVKARGFRGRPEVRAVLVR